MLTLLQAIKKRQAENREKGFHYGISTADRFVKTIRECVGSDMCYRYASSKEHSFEDVLKRAKNTLVYSKSDLEVEEIEYEKKEGVILKEVNGITLPKNTLMVFTHKLTSPKQDRDGDILRSEGARLDPKMLLLWQHVPTLPIGKLLRVEQQTEKFVEVTSCIVDINDLSHDAAVMVDNDMARLT